MTQAVVDVLEPVEIEEQHGHGAAGALEAGDRLLEAVEEQAAVGEARQGVVQRLGGESVGGPGPLDDTAHLGTASGHHLEELLVGVLDLAGEELEHGHDLPAHQHGEGEGGVQPHADGRQRPLALEVGGQVLHPGGPCRRQHPAGDAAAALHRSGLGGAAEGGVVLVALHVPQPAGDQVGAGQRSHVHVAHGPAGVGTHLTHAPAQGPLEGARLVGRHRHRGEKSHEHGVALERPLGPLAVGDVLTDPPDARSARFAP